LGYSDKVLAIACDFEMCLLELGVSDWRLSIGDPNCSENWDLVEPYSKVPVGGGDVAGLTDDCCRLEEAEHELAVPRDELVAEGKYLACR
jgi:hypothetical protein